MKLFGHLDRMMDHFMIIEDVAGEKKGKTHRIDAM